MTCLPCPGWPFTTHKRRAGGSFICQINPEHAIVGGIRPPAALPWLDVRNPVNDIYGADRDRPGGPPVPQTRAGHALPMFATVRV